MSENLLEHCESLNGLDDSVVEEICTHARFYLTTQALTGVDVSLFNPVRRNHEKDTFETWNALSSAFAALSSHCDHKAAQLKQEEQTDGNS